MADEKGGDGHPVYDGETIRGIMKDIYEEIHDPVTQSDVDAFAAGKEI